MNKLLFLALLLVLFLFSPLVRAQSPAAKVTWNASASTVTGYYPYRGNVSGGPYTRLTAAPIAALTYTDSTVINGNTYFYVATAVDSSGVESAFSNEGTAVIPAVTPPPATSPSMFLRYGTTASYTDASGNAWKPGSCSGSTYSTSHAIGGTTTQPLYQFECYAKTFTLKVTGLSAGTLYTVTAKFAELYWSSAGGRIFSIAANGAPWISNLDIFKEVGQYAADDKSTTVTADSTGAATFVFTASADNAKIDSLSLVASGPAPPPVTVGISCAVLVCTITEANIPSGTTGTVNVSIGGATASTAVKVP